jgi:L-ascorbate metabolism protein UlaG (beta-lactamase superfamily)
VARRFSIDTAILHLGDAHVEIRGPDRLTMNAHEGVEAARAIAPRTIVPVHYEGWAHFKEPKTEAQAVFAAVSLASRIAWRAPGVATTL